MSLLLHYVRIIPFRSSVTKEMTMMTNFAILVSLWDDQLGKPVTRFLHMSVCNIGTADKLFDAIDTTLVEKKIPWSNVVGFESDTTNVMMGKHNSVLSHVKSKQPGVFSQGCVCHLSNLCLLAGVNTLPVDVDFFVNLFYFFNKSTKRKEENSRVSRVYRHQRT